MYSETPCEFRFLTPTVDEHGEVVAHAAGRVAGIAVDLGHGITLEMVSLPGGTFTMGSPPGIGYPDEMPQRRVSVPPLLIGRSPVTQVQWSAVVGRPAHSRGRGRTRPVENINWYEAAEFCRRLSSRSGRRYRLPSEAEWEYACRAGTNTPFWCGETLTTELANYVGERTYGAGPKGIYRHETTDVGSFPPSGFGLFDTLGNVWEWCADTWHDDYRGAPANAQSWEDAASSQYRVVRGGSWHDGPDLCRCATRLKVRADEGDDFFGFRVAAG